MEEVDYVIRAVMMVADHAETWLKNVLHQILEDAILPLAELPNVKLKPKELQSIGVLLGACDPHARGIFSYIIERWQRAGYIIETKVVNPSLRFPFGPSVFNLAALRPAIGGKYPMIVTSWEGLRLFKAFPTEVVDRYQSAINTITDVKVTESMGHIEITQDFNKEYTKKLVKAMIDLAKSVKHDLVESPPITSYPKIKDTLDNCAPRVQEMYSLLLQGWKQAGGSVQTIHPDRIYLKLKTGEHQFGDYGLQSHIFNLVVLVAKEGKLPNIQVTWGLSTGNYAYLNTIPEQIAEFETAISKLPGFEQRGTITRLVIDDDFQLEHAKTLLDEMVAVKKAEEDSRPSDES